MHWSDVYALLSDLCASLQGEIGDTEKDQSVQAFAICIKVICPPLKSNRTLQGFLRELGGVAGENDNK